MSRKLLLVALSLSLFVIGCDTITGGEESDNQLRLELENLPQLNGSFHYEAWMFEDKRLGEAAGPYIPNSVGKFDLDANGDLVDLNGNPISNNTLEADFNLTETDDQHMIYPLIRISIENSQQNTEPSGTVVLHGGFAIGRGRNFEATLEVNGFLWYDTPIANGIGGWEGTYRLDDNQESVWFFTEPEGGGDKSPSLNLAARVPGGWRYQAWVELPGGDLVNAGKFGQVNAADDNGPSSPAFPGEEIGQDLTGGKVIVTLEPNPDDAADTPFTIMPLKAPIRSNAQDSVDYNLANTYEAPRGVATIQTNKNVWKGIPSVDPLKK